MAENSREMALLVTLQKTVDELAIQVAKGEATAAAVLEAMKDELKSLTAAIRGNGQPGMMTQLVKVEEQVASLQRRLERLEKDQGTHTKDSTDRLWKVILGIIGALVAAGIGFMVKGASG